MTGFGGTGGQEDGERKFGGRRKLSKFGGQRGRVLGEQEGRRMGRGSLGAGGSLASLGGKEDGFFGEQEDGERKFGGRRKLGAKRTRFGGGGGGGGQEEAGGRGQEDGERKLGGRRKEAWGAGGSWGEGRGTPITIHIFLLYVW